MKTRISIPLLSCGIVAAGTLFSPSAHADDRMHRVPGMECEIQSDDASYASYIKSDYYGRACNTHSSKTLRLVCPVIQDNWRTSSSQSYQGRYWSAQVYRKASGGFNWDCTALSRKHSGSAYWYSDLNDTSHSSGVSGQPIYYWYAMSGTVNAHHRWGHSMIRCRVPAGECLAGYSTSVQDCESGNHC